MATTGSLRRSWVAALLVAGLVVVGLPAAALAQQCATPDGTLVDGLIVGIMNETMENPPAQAAPLGPLLAGTYADGFRLAQATESGVLGVGGACGDLQGLQGSITVHARSKVPVGPTGLGIGQISGAFSVTAVSGIVNGKLDGFLDFTLTDEGVTACSGNPCPIVPVQGAWSTQGPRGQSGMFQGVALVPFQYPGLGWVYLDPIGVLPGGIPGGPNSLVPLDPSTDFDQFGNPEAKFIITMAD